MQLRSRGSEGRFGGISRTTRPIGHNPAGPSDDRNERGDVPRVHNGIEHHVGPAAGDEQVAVAVAPSSDEFGGSEDASACRTVLIFGEIERVAGEKRGLSEARGGAAAHGATVERGDLIIAEHELAKNRLMNAAEHGLTLMQQCDERAEERHTADEGLGAVDRIEHPDELGVRIFGAEFFADNPVIGKSFGDEPTEKFLGPFIGDRHGRSISLGFNGQRGAGEMRTNEITTALGELGHEDAVGIEIHREQVGPRHRRNTRKKDSDFLARCVAWEIVGTNWTEQPIFFVDFEGSRVSGVLEYGVVTLLGGRILAGATRLCAAMGRVRAEDVAVHGLHEADLAGRAPFADEWEYFASLRECGPLAAHYAGVENALLKGVWPYPRNSPDFARPGERVIEWGPWIDSARIYGQLYPQLESGKLETLIATCGLQAELDGLAEKFCPADRRHYHAALYDALAGAVLLASLAGEPKIAQMTVMQLLALSTLDGAKRAAITQRELF